MKSTVDLWRGRLRSWLMTVLSALAVLAVLPGLAGPAAAAPAGAPAAPAPGCAAPPAKGTTEHSLVDGGLTRTYRVHVPQQADAHRPLPLLLAFHGRGSDAAELEGFSGLSELPAVVVYPDGVPGEEGKRSWAGAPYAAQGVDDVAFTRRLLDDVAARACVDPARVYATGKSNGGGFAGMLACRAADRIAAAAPVAGAFYPGTGGDGAPCEPGRPIPMLEIHGTADSTIPYGGDAERGLPAIPDWVAGWAERDGCDATPSRGRVEPDVTVTRFGGCAGGAAVEHVAVDGGGHTWPGADAYSGGGHTTHTIRAATVVWEFVARHRLPA